MHQAVKEACCSFLVERLHPRNVIGVRAFGDQHDCGNLVDMANKFIANHFLEVGVSLVADFDDE